MLLQEIDQLCKLVQEYRRLAISEHRYPTSGRDPYAYINTRLRELDKEAQELGIAGIKPRHGDYKDECNVCEEREDDLQECSDCHKPVCQECATPLHPFTTRQDRVCNKHREVQWISNKS